MRPLALVVDDAIHPPDRAAFLPLERGLLYGDGLFETLPVARGVALDSTRHFARMAASARELGLREPARGAWDGAIAMCLVAAGASAAVVRVTWTRGEASGRGYAPLPADGPPRMLVAGFGPIPGAKASGVRAVLVRGLTPGDLARHKTLSAMTYVVAADRARAAGVEEALLVDADDRLLETAGSNLFVAQAGIVRTPPSTRPLLAGIGRARARAWLGELGYSEAESDLGPEDLFRADEAFLTNAVTGAVPLVSVDGRSIGTGRPGPIAIALGEKIRAWREAAQPASP